MESSFGGYSNEDLDYKEGHKLDQGKTRYDLIHTRSLKDLADVLTFGSKKYDDDNWMKVDNWKRRYDSAAMRHLQSWYSGDTLDEETGLPHLAHAMCCLMFLNELTKTALDKEVGTCATCSNNYRCTDYLRNTGKSKVCGAYKQGKL